MPPGQSRIIWMIYIVQASWVKSVLDRSCKIYRKGRLTYAVDDLDRDLYARCCVTPSRVSAFRQAPEENQHNNNGTYSTRHQAMLSLGTGKLVQPRFLTWEGVFYTTFRRRSPEFLTFLQTSAWQFLLIVLLSTNSTNSINQYHKNVRAVHYYGSTTPAEHIYLHGG